METTRASWTTKAETALRTLRGIEGASIQAEGDEIREVHVLTTSNRPAKQIVRDIQTLLLTRFNRTIDHRVVSVAYVEDKPAHADEAREEPAPEEASRPERIRFAGVNVFVAGPRVQAQVELQWNGLPRMGSASGSGPRDESHRLIAAATVAAVQEFLAEEVAFAVRDAEVRRFGNRDVALVCLALVAHRQEKLLTGCCTVERDTPQAVALATLAALNRVVGGLRTREATEYVLRPTST